eukprot:3940299-Rhodomonas_salina.8
MVEAETVEERQVTAAVCLGPCYAECGTDVACGASRARSGWLRRERIGCWTRRRRDGEERSGEGGDEVEERKKSCLLYTSPSPRDRG